MTKVCDPHYIFVIKMIQVLIRYNVQMHMVNATCIYFLFSALHATSFLFGKIDSGV